MPPFVSFAGTVTARKYSVCDVPHRNLKVDFDSKPP